MKISTKFNLFVGFFFFFVIVSVFYSYCGGLHICYSFPFFNAFRPEPQQNRLMVTSYVMESKAGMSYDKEDLIKESDSAYNAVYFKKKHPGHKINHDNAEDHGPPSSITGKVAMDILNKANVSEEEANRALYREEKVDQNVANEDLEFNAMSKENKRPLARKKIIRIHPIRRPPRPIRRPIKLHRRPKPLIQESIFKNLEEELENTSANKSKTQRYYQQQQKTEGEKVKTDGKIPDHVQTRKPHLYKHFKNGDLTAMKHFDKPLQMATERKGEGRSKGLENEQNNSNSTRQNDRYEADTQMSDSGNKHKVFVNDAVDITDLISNTNGTFNEMRSKIHKGEAKNEDVDDFEAINDSLLSKHNEDQIKLASIDLHTNKSRFDTNNTKGLEKEVANTTGSNVRKNKTSGQSNRSVQHEESIPLGSSMKKDKFHESAKREKSDTSQQKAGAQADRPVEGKDIIKTKNKVGSSLDDTTSRAYKHRTHDHKSRDSKSRISKSRDSKSRVSKSRDSKSRESKSRDSKSRESGIRNAKSKTGVESAALQDNSTLAQKEMKMSTINNADNGENMTRSTNNMTDNNSRGNGIDDKVSYTKLLTTDSKHSRHSEYDMVESRGQQQQNSSISEKTFSKNSSKKRSYAKVKLFPQELHKKTRNENTSKSVNTRKGIRKHSYKNLTGTVVRESLDGAPSQKLERGEKPHESGKVSFEDLTRSVRNIKDRKTRNALSTALQKDKKELQKIVIDLKNSYERNKLPFSLSRALRDLVKRPEYLPNTHKTDEGMNKRSYGKALVRVKRLRKGYGTENNAASDRALVRVKRIDTRLSRTPSDQTLIRVKRKDEGTFDINGSVKSTSNSTMLQSYSMKRNKMPTSSNQTLLSTAQKNGQTMGTKPVAQTKKIKNLGTILDPVYKIRNRNFTSRKYNSQQQNTIGRKEKSEALFSKKRKRTIKYLSNNITVSRKWKQPKELIRVKRLDLQD